MIHELKTWPEYFQAVISNKKKFEIRENDRDFKINDELLLKEYDPITKTYTGREAQCIVTYTLDKQPFVPEGYICMAIWLYDWYKINKEAEDKCIDPK